MNAVDMVCLGEYAHTLYVFGPNASPRNPSSAAPCDNGQELLVCEDLYLALMISSGQGGSQNWMHKGEASRDQGVALWDEV